MSTPHIAIMTRVYSRLTADTTLTGLLAAGTGSIFQEMLPLNADTPAVTFTMEVNTPADAFRARVRSLGLQVSVFIERAPANVAGLGTPMDYAQSIITRIIGNWPDKAAGVQPDFGLDRWNAAASSPWAFSAMAHVDIRENHTDEFLQYILGFSVTATQVGI
jgi:hypothetical protein